MTTATRPATVDLVRTGAVAGAVAAACTTALAAAARAADVSLEVDGTSIPVVAFAWWTVVGALLGVLLAWFLRERRRFLSVTATLTALSLVPAIVAPDDTATRLVLIATHVVAAAIVIPVLGTRLAASRR